MATLFGYRGFVLLIVLWIEQLRLVCLDGQYNAYLRVI